MAMSIDRDVTRRWAVIAIGVVAGLLSSSAAADYVATGQIEGQVCRGWVIESCRFAKVAAVAGDNGQLYTVRNRYDEVSDYDERRGRCWIEIKSRGAGYLSDALNALAAVQFYELSEAGQYEEIDVEYLTFPCRVE